MRSAWILLFATACIDGKGSRPDGGGGDGPPGLSDGGSDGAGFVCADDSTFEPNDNISLAFATSVDTTATFALTGLAICPAGDADFFKITLTTQHALEIVVQWDGNPPLATSLLNAAGTSITEGIVMPNMIKMCTPGLPFGTYYARVFATGGGRNNYRLTINAKQTCN